MPKKTQPKTTGKNNGRNNGKRKLKTKPKAKRIGPKRRAALLERRTGSRKTAEIHRAARREGVADRLAEGKTYREVAGELECGLATVFRDVKALMVEWRTARVSKVEDVLTLQNRLLDLALRPLMPKVKEGDEGAIALMMQIIDRRMKLYGLDAKAIFQHWQEILGPDEQERARTTDRSIATGLREIETIVERHGGSRLPAPPDPDDPGSKPLN